MNQILFNKKTNNKLKYIFKVQLSISIIIAFLLTIIIIANYQNEQGLEKISKMINKNIELKALYGANEENMYLGKIQIDKINLDYAVFNNFDDSLLKIAPCKFHGKSLEEKGNICIAAHNYNDNRFFGKLDKLEIKDVIKIFSMDNIEYNYIIYDIFETDENDTSIFFSNRPYELTLLTCNNSNKKRIIVKAYRKEY